MITHEELIRQREKVKVLITQAQESQKFLMRICNGISLAERLDSDKNKFSQPDNLIFILKDSIVDHLNSISSLVSAFEEYSKMLDRINPGVIEIKEIVP